MKKITALFLMVISTSVFASELTTIGNIGETQTINQQDQASANLELYKKLQNPIFRHEYIKKQLAQIKEQSYTVSTPELSLGRVESRPTRYPNLPQPLAIVGCDRTSMSWLSRNVNKLTEINPMVDVVNCDGKEDFLNLKRIAPKLRFMPLNGSDISTVFKINHYPVLITKRSISQ